MRHTSPAGRCQAMARRSLLGCAWIVARRLTNKGCGMAMNERRVALGMLPLAALGGRADAANYDVGPDGKWFVFVAGLGDRPMRSIQMVLNWFDHVPSEQRR